MKTTYEVVVNPNWGISRPIAYTCTQQEAFKRFKACELGGAGNVVSVYLKRNGVIIRARHLIRDDDRYTKRKKQND